MREGFSLIELLVVVAIIAVLAAIALPTYQSYSIKAKVTTALNLLQAQAIPIINTYNQTGTFPIYENTILYTPPAGSPVDHIYAWSYPTGNGCANTNYTAGTCIQIAAVMATGVIPTANGGLTATPDGGNILYLMVFGNVNGATMTFCGTDSRANLAFPSQYLPASCIPNLYSGTSFPPGIP